MIRRLLLAGAAIGAALSLAVLPAIPAAGSQRGVGAVNAVNDVAGLRRLTEAQYRNSIADIFGPDIVVAGRFEPIVRTGHELLASGATSAAISPAGLEQFDLMARSIAAQVFDQRHRPVFAACAAGKETGYDERCARQVLGRLGRYVMRRPLTVEETSEYVGMARIGAEKTGSFHDGLELALAAMLVAPEFLYIVETVEPDPANPGKVRLDNNAMATRLSYLFWNTTPDKALLDAATAGILTDPDELRRQAERMAASERFKDGVRAFFADMLKFEKFEELAKDPVIYPRFNREVAQALPEQILLTIESHLVDHDGNYRELFTTPQTFMTRSLGPLYGIPVRQSKGWEPYRFADGDDRVGLLGQAGFLALYSHSGRSSPTLRGRAIRELLMCQPVPNPPGNVNFTAVQETGNVSMPTARIRLAAHATEPACTGCHRITDPIGLPLERFDGIGAFRPTENDAPIDVTGSIDGIDFAGATGLGRALAENPATTSCVASRALEYAAGRSFEDDWKLIEGLDADFGRAGFRIRDLFIRIATMPESYRVAMPGVGEERGQLAISGK